MILLCLCVATINAQTYYYNTTEFAYKQKINGQWTAWSDWEKSNMLVTIDFTNDIIRIYSPVHQKYTITQYIKNYTDYYGGKQVEFRFIDQDYDYGTMRLRIEANGNAQIYIDFIDVMWVYNVVRRDN